MLRGNQRGRNNRRRRGQAAVEIALMSPMIFLLFLALFTFGFHAYTVIMVENAARVAVLYTSQATVAAADSNTACYYALTELRALPNVGGGLSCPGNCTTPGQACTAGPITVEADSVTGIDGAPASQVRVTYQGVQLFPLPFLMGQMTISRIAQMRI